MPLVSSYTQQHYFGMPKRDFTVVVIVGRHILLDTSPLKKVLHRLTSIQHICGGILRKMGSLTCLKNVNIRNTYIYTHIFVTTNSLSERSSQRKEVYCIRRLKWKIQWSTSSGKHSNVKWKINRFLLFLNLGISKLTAEFTSFTIPVMLLEDFGYILTIAY